MKLSNLTYLAVDTETNVPEGKQLHELVEASAVIGSVTDDDDYFVDIMENAQEPKPHKPYLKSEEYVTCLCKPPSPMSPEASAVHNMRDEDLVDFPPVEEVLPKFINRTNGFIWVIHNAAYDWEIFIRHAQMAGVEAPRPLVVIDSLLFAQALLKERKTHKLQILAHLFKTKRATKGAHRATADCGTLGMVFNNLVRVYLERGGEDSVEAVLGLICRHAVDVNLDQELWFGKHKGTKFGDLPEDYLLWWLFKKKPDPAKPSDPKLDLLFASEYYTRNPNDAVKKKIDECTANCGKSITWPSHI